MTRGNIRSLLATAVSACALLAFGAAPAMAAVSWTQPDNMAIEGTLVVERGGSDAKECTGAGDATAVNYSGIAAFYFDYPYSFDMTCDDDSTLQMGAAFGGAFGSPGDYYLELGLPDLESPWGWYSNYAVVPFVNGSGGSPSTLVFDDTSIGTDGHDEITASGTMTVTDTGSGTLTLTGSD